MSSVLVKGETVSDQGRIFTALAGFSGFLSVALGAFGAHGLQAHLAALQMTEVYHTAVQYHMVHTLALLGVALLMERTKPNRYLTLAGWLFVVGIVLFSGSLYVLAISGLRVLGAITPFGGLCFLSGWLCLAVATLARS
ncbi:MAG TPA: DUF423 domain-containing protein [Chthonomonas sp.]|uniref:DUF423 domain-containing protein n=1 Tax=Chthonomonas sp. TaxID=2282153 RepID=UPI002B4B3164|nr:DUF423 domain-containing protein [Chthonomonas sp.]HLI48424.1 DUF423 domain-containing protein [Chthonomonas sp.]